MLFDKKWAPNGKKISIGNTKGEISIVEGSQFNLEQSVKIQVDDNTLLIFS